MVTHTNSWIEDYIQPAIEKNKVDNFQEMLKKTRAQVEKKIAQEKMDEIIDNDNDPDETETEDSESDDDVKISKQSGRKAKAQNGKKKIAQKAKPTKTKAKPKPKQKNSEEDLIAAIRNKNGRGNPLASIAARYGVSSVEDDPLDDAKFAELRSKYSKKK